MFIEAAVEETRLSSDPVATASYAEKGSIKQTSASKGGE